MLYRSTSLFVSHLDGAKKALEMSTTTAATSVCFFRLVLTRGLCRHLLPTGAIFGNNSSMTIDGSTSFSKNFVQGDARPAIQWLYLHMGDEIVSIRLPEETIRVAA